MTQGGQIRIPPYLDAGPRRHEAVCPVLVPGPGPAVVVVWPDAPSRSAVERVAREVERALRAAWPAVASDRTDAP
jgi:hypothetical protein